MAFRCPVEATAAVYRVSATLEGRTITGVTMEKKKVPQEYEIIIINYY